MASTPYSPAAQADDTSIADGKERRRPQKRGTESRVVHSQKAALANEEMYSPADDENLDRSPTTLIEVIEPDAPKDAEIRDISAAAEIVPHGETAEEPTRDAASEAASVSPALPMGNVDALDCYRIQGWAWFPTAPDEPVDLDILVDDTIVTQVRADRFRAGLKDAGAGNGHHGFLVQNLEAHIASGTHVVRVLRASDGFELPGSPRSVTRAEPADDSEGGDPRGHKPPSGWLLTVRQT